MRPVRLAPGRPIPNEAEGGVLARDLAVDGVTWRKGRLLSAADLAALASAGDVQLLGLAPTGVPGVSGIPVIIPEAGDLHEDEAARRIAAVIAGPGLDVRGPIASRVDLVAAHQGVLRVDVALLVRIDRWDPIAVFTGLDGQVVVAGAVVGAAKVGPHVVPAAVIERLERTLATAASKGRHVVRVDGFARRRVAVLVKETIGPEAGSRFETSVAARIASLGSDLVAVRYVPDEANAVVHAVRSLVRGSGRVDIVLTAGAAVTDPGDAFFVAIDRLRGRIVSRGVPAHPGSMLWVARVAGTAILGLPTCGAYSRVGAVDLLLPWILAGSPVDRRTIARLGHGGLLTRDMRFRFPAYAREVEAPEG